MTSEDGTFNATHSFVTEEGLEPAGTLTSSSSD